MRNFLLPRWRDLLALVLVGLLPLALLLVLPAAPRTALFAVDGFAFGMPAEGFDVLEADPAAGVSFRWTSGPAVIFAPNPGGGLLLDLRLIDGPAGKTPLRLGVGDSASLLQLTPGLRRYRLLAPPQPGEHVAIRLDAPTTVVNERPLGVALSAMRVSGAGTPAMLPPLIALAAASLFLLLRRAALGLPAALGAALALGLAAALWHRYGPWQLSLLTPALTALASVGLLGSAQGARQGHVAFGLWPLAFTALLIWWFGQPLIAPLTAAGAALLALGGAALLREVGVGRLAAAGMLWAGVAAALLVAGSAPGQQGVLGLALLGLGAAALAAPLVERRLPPVAHAPTSLRLGRADLLPLALLLGAALAIRIPWIGMPDPVGDLEITARRMASLAANGLAGAYNPPGDYMPLRIYLLSGLVGVAELFGIPLDGVPTPAVVALIKLPNLCADLAGAALIYAWARARLGARRGALLAAAYTLAPPVWINVAWWGQVDTLLMLPMLLTVLLIDRGRGGPAWVAWTVALLVKTQAILLAPLLVIATFRRHGSRGLAAGAISAGATVLVALIPLGLAGQLGGMLSAYTTAVGRFPRATSGAYNLWYLWLGPGPHDSVAVLGGLSARLVGLGLLAGAVLLIGWALVLRPDPPTRLRAAALIGLAFFCLPTQIHERYLFLALAFTALCVADDERWAWPFMFLTLSATINILAELSGFVPIVDATLGRSPLRYALAVLNLAALAGLLVWTLRGAGAWPRRAPR